MLLILINTFIVLITDDTATLKTHNQASNTDIARE